jgi:hypothetical protein
MDDSLKTAETRRRRHQHGHHESVILPASATSATMQRRYRAVLAAAYEKLSQHADPGFKPEPDALTDMIEILDCARDLLTNNEDGMSEWWVDEDGGLRFI